MALSSPNEPTEGPGGMPVYDSEGVLVGHVRQDEEVEAPSEDMARVIIHVSDDLRSRYGLQDEAIDVEAQWLEAPDIGDRLLLDRPIAEALSEQGFDI